MTEFRPTSPLMLSHPTGSTYTESFYIGQRLWALFRHVDHCVVVIDRLRANGFEVDAQEFMRGWLDAKDNGVRYIDLTLLSALLVGVDWLCEQEKKYNGG